MAADNLKYCKWCKHTMLKDALVCQQCRFGQAKLNKPGLSKVIEIASIVIALCAVETEALSSIVADSLRVIYQNTVAELATEKELLDLLCPSDLTEASLRLDCDIRHVDFSAKAVNALVWFTTLSPSVAENSNIDKLGAIETICGYQPNNIDDLFNAGDYVMGLENYVPYQQIPEILVENPEDIPTEAERQLALDSLVVKLYKNQSKKWVSAGTSSYENLKKLCS